MKPAEPMMKAADRKHRRHDDDDAKLDDDDAMPPALAHKIEKEDDGDLLIEHKEKSMDDDDDCEPSPVMKAADRKRRDAEGSNPVEHGPAGEIKPDDDDDEAMPPHHGAHDDDDDQKLAAKMDAQHARYADVQAKADSIFAAFGKSASRPLQGESVVAYRKRLLRGLQGYSDAYKSVNVRAISDKALLDIAEKQIFADALAAAKNPVAYGDQLIEHRSTDRAGRTISTFTGSVSAWLDQFKVAPMRVVEFRTPNVNYR
jgi:hypothetical protein